MSSNLSKSYAGILNSLKEKIRQKRRQASILVNTQLLKLYWEIGNGILKQQAKEGWGTKVIDRLSKDLRADFPDMEGLSVRNIKYMRAFSEAYPDLSIVQEPLAQISWYHHITLLDKVKDASARMFYIGKPLKTDGAEMLWFIKLKVNFMKGKDLLLLILTKTLSAPQTDLANETLG